MNFFMVYGLYGKLRYHFTYFQFMEEIHRCTNWIPAQQASLKAVSYVYTFYYKKIRSVQELMVTVNYKNETLVK